MGWAVADVAAFVLGVRERTIDRTVSGKVVWLSAYIAGAGSLRSHSLRDVWPFRRLRWKVGQDGKEVFNLADWFNDEMDLLRSLRVCHV